MKKIIIRKDKTASFDVDPQYSFTEQCPNELPVIGGDRIGNELNNNAQFGCLRILSKDAHPSNAFWIASEETPMFSEVNGNHKNLDIHWNKHCEVGSFGFQILSELPKEEDYDFLIYKGLEKNMHPYGACYHDLDDKISTGVIEFLTFHNIDTVIVGGLATDYCVSLTAKQLKKAGFNVIVNLNSCKGIADETVSIALDEFNDLDIIVINNLNNLVLSK